MSQSKTHLKINSALCGDVVELADNRARVALTVSDAMVADEFGLGHGGFTFGMADYAAMLAVNEPTVVLGQGSMKFLAPTRLGDKMEAEAVVESEGGKKRSVQVTVKVGDTTVATGDFTCFVPERHILDKA